MYVAASRVVLRIDMSGSLKDKRSVIKSLLERIRSRFNVSAAEIGRLESWHEGEIGLAAVSNDPAHARNVIETVVRYIESDGRAEIVTVERESW